MARKPKLTPEEQKRMERVADLRASAERWRREDVGFGTKEERDARRAANEAQAKRVEEKAARIEAGEE